MNDSSAVLSTESLRSESTRQVADLADLACVFEPGIQVVRLARESDTAIARETDDALRVGTLGCGFRVMLPADARPDSTVLPRLACAPALLADIDRMVELYVDLMECPAVGLRLEVLGRAMCPRFHVDRVGLRMLVTYRGPATEWLDDAGTIGRAMPFDVVLLKGSLWPGNETRGAIHRSPAVPDGQAPRVLLALDAIWP
jgi:hypothetical protein